MEPQIARTSHSHDSSSLDNSSGNQMFTDESFIECREVKGKEIQTNYIFRRQKTRCNTINSKYY